MKLPRFQDGQLVRVTSNNAAASLQERRLKRTEGVIQAYVGWRRTAKGLIPVGQHSYNVSINGQIRVVDEDGLEPM